MKSTTIELTLHRVDAAAMQGKSFERRNEVITLAAVKAPPKKRGSGFLEFDNEPRAPWDGKGTVTQDRFQGELVRLSAKFPTAGRTREEQESQVPGALDQKPLTIQFRPFLPNAGLFVAACDAFFFKKYPLDLPARPGTSITLRIKK